MARYTILVSPEAVDDIKKAEKWYEEELPGLGLRFKKQVISQIESF